MSPEQELASGASGVRVLASGLVFGESPRWHAGRLWFVDFGAQEVGAVDLHGNRELIGRMPSMPMGLGFAPDGRLLVVAVREARLLRCEPDGSLTTYADLSSLSKQPWGELVVDGRGNAYVGNLGFEFPGGQFAPGSLALVTPDGSLQQVADGVAFPNGMAVTPDNSTLILAETYAHRLTAFDIAADGSLSNRRVWAELGDAFPDGICLDADGAVWYADVPAKRCVRVREGGMVLQTLTFDRGCFACVLGGETGTTLFVMAAEFGGASNSAPGRTGQVLAVEAPARGVGWP
jgi:sugar lactone lactonase YvrE